jgi:hypothetical protein
LLFWASVLRDFVGRLLAFGDESTAFPAVVNFSISFLLWHLIDVSGGGLSIIDWLFSFSQV